MVEAIICLSNIIFLPRDLLSAHERAVNYWQNFLCASAGTQTSNQFVDWVPLGSAIGDGAGSRPLPKQSQQKCLNEMQVGCR
jgi:hypothetical protein